jgi:hypothetical protein
VAQTKRKRRSKHRGNAAGIVESRGRTGRKPTSSESKPRTRDEARQRREDRISRPPTWRSAIQRAAVSGFAFIILVALLFHRSIVQAVALGLFVTLFYIPLGYYTDQFVYRRRMAKKAKDGGE